MEFIDAKKAKELIKGADRLPRAEIDRLATERLEFIIKYARYHSPYLREKYADLPDNFTLRDIPVSTRAEMDKNFDRWLCDPAVTKKAVKEYASDLKNLLTPFLGKYTMLATSGTTAAPFHILRDARHLAVHGALMNERYFHGPLLNDVPNIDDAEMKICGIIPELVCSTYVSLLKIKHSYEQHGKGDMVKSISVLSSTKKIVEELNEFQPDMIGCYPSVIYTLAHEQKAGRLHIHPRFIGCSAEKLTEEKRRFISEAFDCPVNNNYCSTEGGEVAMLCPNGHLHLNSDWIIVEPVDMDLNPVAAGVYSDGVLITNLACLVQPVIRYHMTDSIILHDEPCGCGLNTPYIDIEGRVDDLLEFNRNGRVIYIAPSQLEISSELEGNDKCQFIQRSDNEVEVRISTFDNYDRQALVAETLKCVYKQLEELGLDDVKLTFADEPLIRTKGGKLRLAFKDFNNR